MRGVGIERIGDQDHCQIRIRVFSMIGTTALPLPAHNRFSARRPDRLSVQNQSARLLSASDGLEQPLMLNAERKSTRRVVL